jgi:aryl-alcohol dehydrogenase-like predicted oxidoreductase
LAHVVANKLWWEFWPQETPAQELAGSLGRMRFDYVDLLYSDRLPVDDAVGMIAGLIEAGMARAWGALNWDPDQIELAGQIAERASVPGSVSWRLYSSSVSPSPLRACRLGRPFSAPVGVLRDSATVRISTSLY